MRNNLAQLLQKLGEATDRNPKNSSGNGAVHDVGHQHVGLDGDSSLTDGVLAWSVMVRNP